MADWAQSTDELTYKNARQELSYVILVSVVMLLLVGAFGVSGRKLSIITSLCQSSRRHV